jgi:DNA-directed RNA polymerase sigma subunit (sigma70/sigma32)
MAVHRNQVAALLRGLSPLQEKVVRLYFGIGCERSHSASEIAREFQVSSQVIGGILGGAQRRLAKVGLTPRKLAEAALPGATGLALSEGRVEPWVRAECRIASKL